MAAADARGLLASTVHGAKRGQRLETIPGTPPSLDHAPTSCSFAPRCGFANFGSLGIMIGGLGTMAPQRRNEINALGLKSIVSGTLVTCLMGAIVGVLT